MQKDAKVCEQLPKREMDVPRMLSTRSKMERTGARFVGVKDKRHKLRWSGNNDGKGGCSAPAGI